MGDIVIHAGNISAVGTREDIQVQLDWLKGLPHKHKIYVCGNTNYWFDQFTRLPEDVDSPGLLDIGPIYVLKDAYASLKCGEPLINVYGAAHFPVADGTYRPFAYTRDGDFWRMKTPLGTDIVVTHTPPAHHLDDDTGCESLLEETWRANPKLHVFGNARWHYWVDVMLRNKCQRAFERLMSRPDRN